MKKGYLAAAAILGAAVSGGQAQAAKIDLGNGNSFKLGFRGKVYVQQYGKRNDNDKSDLIIRVPNARIYAKGSISKILKWGFQGDFLENQTLQLVDAYVMLSFAKEFNVSAGWIKLPFELHSGIQSGWSFVMPTGPSYENLPANPFINPAADGERAAGSGSRSPQVNIWGKVADGMLKYYLYLVDGRDENSTNGEKTGYGVRVEFAPTVFGYKGHPGYVLKETYAGKQNTLVLGLAYFSEKTGNETAKSLGVDLLWEQNLGSVTPNLSIGYVDHKNFRGTKDDDIKGLIVQGQVLLNQKTMLGKPAIGLRWAQSDPKTRNSGEKASVLGVTGQFYVKGTGNRIALSVDRVTNKAPNTKDYTDVTLAFWYNF